MTISLVRTFCEVFKFKALFVNNTLYIFCNHFKLNNKIFSKTLEKNEASKNLLYDFSIRY